MSLCDSSSQLTCEFVSVLILLREMVDNRLSPSSGIFSLSAVLTVSLSPRTEKRHLNSPYPQSHCRIPRTSGTAERKSRMALSLLSILVFLLLTPNCSGNSRVFPRNRPIYSRSEVSHFHMSSLKMSCLSIWLEPYTPHT